MIQGLYGISAKIIADATSPDGVRLTTYELTYPRLVLAELNTHRMLSKNSASSRAIPFEKMLQQLDGRPVRFGAANPGMQDKGEEHDGCVNLEEVPYLTGITHLSAPVTWKLARQAAIWFSKALYKAGYHKQVFNRLTEPFQMMKTVVSGTEWNNLFWLRDHIAADPTLAELARCMREEMAQSRPVALQPGEWSLPYVDTYRAFGDPSNPLMYWINDGSGNVQISLDDAKAVSAARTAAVSFRNIDYGLKKCLEVYQRLVGDDRKHASAFEHQGTPMQPHTIDHTSLVETNWRRDPGTWEPGISHMDKNEDLWSGNFKGFIQLRKLIPGECKEG